VCHGVHSGVYGDLLHLRRAVHRPEDRRLQGGAGQDRLVQCRRKDLASRDVPCVPRQGGAGEVQRDNLANKCCERHSKPLFFLCQNPFSLPVTPFTLLSYTMGTNLEKTSFGIPLKNSDKIIFCAASFFIPRLCR